MAEKAKAVSPNTKDGPRICEDCKITFPDVFEYVDHLESKEHKKSAMKNKYGAKYLEAKAALLGSDLSKESESESEKIGSSDDEDEVYTCKTCQKICTGILSYKLHLSGKKHQKNVKKAEMLKQMKADKIIPDDDKLGEGDTIIDEIFTKNEFAPSEMYCKVCDKKCPGPESFKQHNKSEGHRKKLAVQNLLKDLKTTEEKSDIDDDENFSCAICNKVFSGPLSYKQHMQSGNHLKQVQDSEKLAVLKDLVVSTDDRRKLQCKDCHKTFSGPKPFKDHLKSASHSKLKQKKELLQQIKEKYPEMIFASNNSDGEADSDDNTIICSICHTASTGPESARDHVESQKHKKAMKKKIRVDEIKLLKNGKKSKDVTKTNTNSDKLLSSDEDFCVISRK